ncbi:spermatogenesis-associated protein 7 isoform X2 [Bufo bufo]|uniref:spermatogenesis-associated protein 7 isoform X2 n=1 Tax=Bufo bufo TaxID=8384 RepID=UPI001ABECF96|nr:spermatogenesis-associated protein 7 isoform X2 [Bufo bufo]
MSPPVMSHCPGLLLSTLERQLPGIWSPAGSRAPSVPSCGVSSPFRGHLSTKSNAFCIGHSSRLSDQYRIRDRMLLHYNKILSAKAAVDCSIPKSMIKSVKYSDQQKRERMKKEAARMERTSAVSSRPRSRDSVDSIMHSKDPYDSRSPLLRHSSPYSDRGPVYSPSSFFSSPRPLRSPAHTGELQGRYPESSRLPGGLSTFTAWSSPCKFQDNQTKTYSGDLLEKHSHHFTNKERPFTPRTLKTQAKSALAQSRYYTPPRRKKKGMVTEAEAQTEISSFRRTSPERESSPIGDQGGNNEDLLLSDEDDEGTGEQRRPLSRLSTRDFMSPSPTLQKIHSEEEELAYLNFVADVTNEILSLGLFSDRVLERVFQRHLEGNRHRLDEGKMRHLLDILRADLDCKQESNLKSVVGHHFDTRGHFTSSPWVINGSSLEDESSYLDSLITDHHVHVDPLPDMKHYLQHDALAEPGTTTTKHGDYVRVGADGPEGDHHQEDDAQSDQEGGGDLSPWHSHDHLSSLDGPEDKGSPDHEDDVDLQVLKETPEDNLLLDVSSKDQTLDNLLDARHISEKVDNLDTLEDLQQSFYEVVQISRGNDGDVTQVSRADDGEDSGEEEASETEEPIDL